MFLYFSCFVDVVVFIGCDGVWCELLVNVLIVKFEGNVWIEEKGYILF